MECGESIGQDLLEEVGHQGPAFESYRCSLILFRSSGDESLFPIDFTILKFCLTQTRISGAE